MNCRVWAPFFGVILLYMLMPWPDKCLLPNRSPPPYAWEVVSVVVYAGTWLVYPILSYFIYETPLPLG